MATHGQWHERWLTTGRISALLIGALALAGALLIALARVEPASAAIVKTCYDRGYEDLKAKRIDCDTARRVYRRSLTVASQNQDASVTRFRSVGLRWTCRAYNPPAVAFYTWRCTANRGRVMVQYRWKSGD